MRRRSPSWASPSSREKEIVAILAPRTMKHKLMLAINEAAGIKTDSRGLLMSLPVEDIMGL